jgi:hypothetical protein
MYQWVAAGEGEQRDDADVRPDQPEHHPMAMLPVLIWKRATLGENALYVEEQAPGRLRTSHPSVIGPSSGLLNPSKHQLSQIGTEPECSNEDVER